MRYLIAVALLVCTSCRDVSPVPPTPPPTPSPPAPLLMMEVSGEVVDTAHRDLSGARVEVIAGSSAGSAITTNEFGRFLMPEKIAAPFTLRVTKEGFVPATRVFPDSPRPITGNWVDFWIEMTVDGPVVKMTGTYTLTLSADSACTSLPVEARVRTYTATILSQPKPTEFRVALGGARFVAPFDGFGLQTAGDFVRFYVYRYFDEVEPGIVEQLQNDTFLAITGVAATTAEPSGIANSTTAFEGVFEYCAGQPGGHAYRCASDARLTCTSANHRFTLVKG
jgi:hypothetical protein